MRPSRVLSSSLVAALALLPLAAQEATTPFRLPEVRTAPIERIVHAVYDVQSDTTRVVRVSEPGELGLGTPPCFDNSDLSYPAGSYVVSNSGEDLMNWGTKRCSESSLLRALTVAYQSEAVDPAQGGPGAEFSIALYTGTTGFGQPGTEVFRRTFTGMPTNGLVTLRIDFGTDPLPLADGGFGWSYLQLDGDTGPLLVRAPRPLLGTVDAMDVYSPGPARASTYVGTFNYGGCQDILVACANTWMQLEEILNRETARSDVLNGTGVNPVLLEEVLPARLGEVWAARVNVTAPPSGVPYTILFGSRAAAGPVSTRFGEVLIDASQQVFHPRLAEAGYSFAVPADTSLVGFRIFLQAAVIPPAAPSVFLTNSLRVRVGY